MIGRSRGLVDGIVGSLSTHPRIAAVQEAACSLAANVSLYVDKHARRNDVVALVKAAAVAFADNSAVSAAARRALKTLDGTALRARWASTRPRDRMRVMPPPPTPCSEVRSRRVASNDAGCARVASARWWQDLRVATPRYPAPQVACSGRRFVRARPPFGPGRTTVAVGQGAWASVHRWCVPAPAKCGRCGAHLCADAFRPRLTWFCL